MLSFETLREANKQRLPQFKNAKGEPSHTEPDGSDWSLNDWMTAVVGEIGGAASILKKVRRGDLTLDQARPELRREFADIVCYLDILAMQCGIELGASVRDKFNEISSKVGANVRIGTDDDWHQRWSTSGVYSDIKVCPHCLVEEGKPHNLGCPVLVAHCQSL